MRDGKKSWRLADAKDIYIIDTDVLAHIWFRRDSDEIYRGLIALAEKGTVRTVRQTFEELEKHKPVFEHLKDYKDRFQMPIDHQFCAEVKERIEILGKDAPHLWAQTGGKNPDPADPWMIAVAATYGYTVVTDENPRSPFMVPAACRLPKIGCECKRGPQFLVEVGIVTKVEPAHIEPHSFFNL